MRAYELEESAVEELKNRLPKLKRHTYNTIDSLMQNISARHKITGKKLHDMFVKKYGHTPDTWIKKFKNRLGEEGVAEVSDKTLTNYLTKVDTDSRKHKMDPTKRPAHKASKSVTGFSRAFNKLDSRKPDGSIEEGWKEKAAAAALAGTMATGAHGVVLNPARPIGPATANRPAPTVANPYPQPHEIQHPLNPLNPLSPTYVGKKKPEEDDAWAKIEKRKAKEVKEQGVAEGQVVPLQRTKDKIQYGKRTFPATQRNVSEPESNITPIQKKSKVGEDVEGATDIEKIKDFIKWSYKTLNMQKPYPKITLSKNTEKAKEGHHTGVHSGNDIWVYIGNRNLIDIFRTIFHELTHHRQMQLNMIKHGDSYPGSPIEMLADMAAGKYIKIYGKEHPEIFQ